MKTKQTIDPPLTPLLPLSVHRSNELPEEARGLKWEDTFFDSEDDDKEHVPVAVFDIDYVAMERASRTGLLFWFFMSLFLLFCWSDDGDFVALLFSILSAYFGTKLAYYRYTGRLRDWHLAVTRTEVVVHAPDRSKALRVPFESIYKISVEGGAQVQASSSRSQQSSCTSAGLSVILHIHDFPFVYLVHKVKNARRFRDLVLAMQSSRKETMMQNSNLRHGYEIQIV